MQIIPHKSASSDHYNNQADRYDLFNEKNSLKTNIVIAEILHDYNVESVLDLTCGTGSQVFYLHELGFKVVGYDINKKMLDIAKNKAKSENMEIAFNHGDMRKTQAGSFDAVITIFNAVGHLTKNDFSKAMQNINNNLKQGGIYIFDIFNLDFLLHEDNITKLTIDFLKRKGGVVSREIQYSTITPDGNLSSYDIYFEVKDEKKARITNDAQTLQVYTANQLQDMLVKAGFEVIEQTDMKREKMHVTQTERILTVARKIY